VGAAGNQRNPVGSLVVVGFSRLAYGARLALAAGVALHCHNPGLIEAGAGAPTASGAPVEVVAVKLFRHVADLAQVNALRRRETRACGADELRGARRSLGTSSALTCAAEAQCTGMAVQGYFSHISPDGSTPEQRSARCGYSGRVAENISWGQQDIEAALQSWVSSPGHCRNLFTELAEDAAWVSCEGSAGKRYWVLLIGAPGVAPSDGL
jgi:uncharacterized protein YkwD